MLFVTFLLPSPARHTACLCAVAENAFPSFPLHVHLGLGTTRAVVSILLRKLLLFFFGCDKVFPPWQWGFIMLLQILVNGVCHVRVVGVRVIWSTMMCWSHSGIYITVIVVPDQLVAFWLWVGFTGRAVFWACVGVRRILRSGRIGTVGTHRL